MSLTVAVDVVAGLFGIASAIEWFRSSRVVFPFGYDMDEELRVAMAKAATLNARAALCAGIAVALPSIRALSNALL